MYWVTAYTDAGFQPDYNHGYYAYRAVGDLGRITGSGTTPSYITGSMTAEMYGLFQAAIAVMEAWPQTNGILFCCDCTGALDAINIRTMKRMESQEGAFIQDCMYKFNHLVWVRTKWVKGHCWDGSTQSYLNTWCDKRAAIHRRR